MSIEANAVPPTIADEILDSLTEFADAIDASDDLAGRFTWWRLKMISEPETNAFDQGYNNHCERDNCYEPE